MNNNLMTRTTNTVLSKELLPVIKENGKYGIALLGVIYIGNLVHDAVIKAMDKGYEVDVQAGKDKIAIKFTQPNNTWQEPVNQF